MNRTSWAFLSGFVVACVFTDASLEASVKAFLYVGAFVAIAYLLDKIIFKVPWP